MKILHFCYEMQLEFEREVTAHHFTVHCIPCTDLMQRLLSLEYDISPADALNRTTDGFGNIGVCGSANAPHKSFFVHSEGTVSVDASIARREKLHPMYRYVSQYTAPDEAILRFVGEYGRAERADQAAEDLMNALYQNFRYMPGVTTTATTASEAFSGGEGVCQDYAHVLISMCRSAGIPARYVAGMMVGEGATHAWVEIYCDGVWIGLDPTHNKRTDEDYIKLTHGRDFADAAVDKGCFLGFAAQKQKVRMKAGEQ